MKRLEDYYISFKDIDGVQAFYCINLKSKKIQSKIIDESHNKSDMLETIRNISNYLRKSKFDMLYIESEEHIFFKSISTNDNIFIIVTDKNLTIGTIFNALKKL